MQYTLKKSLGQHFLHDEQMCQKIVGQVTRKAGMKLLEIGPGGGAITKYLLQWPDIAYKAIEVDEEKVQYLTKTYPQLQEYSYQSPAISLQKPARYCQNRLARWFYPPVRYPCSHPANITHARRLEGLWVARGVNAQRQTDRPPLAC